MSGPLSARLLATVACFALSSAGCRTRDADAKSSTDAASAARAVKVAAALADPTTSPSKPVARWVLPKELNEISGLVIVGDGRLLTHGDERAVIWEVDYTRGVLTKHFSIGTPALAGDFEGITSAKSRYYLLSSNGDLYEFSDGANSSHVPYTKHDSHLGKECEFESVAYDARLDAFLLACKRILMKDKDDGLLIYRWRLGQKPESLPPLVVPLSALTVEHDWKKLHPTDMTVDPTSGNYVLVASQENAIIVLSPDGKVVRTYALPDGHQQPEGIAITRDHVLLLSDEAGKKQPSVTLYRWP